MAQLMRYKSGKTGLNSGKHDHHISQYKNLHLFIGSIIKLIRLNEEASKSVTKQSRGHGGFTSPETWKEPPPELQGMTAVSYLQLHIKTSLCPCQSYQCVITTDLLFITYLVCPIRPERPSPHV